MKVLGVGIDDKLSFAQHAREMGARALKCYVKMSWISATSAGLHVVRSTLLRAQTPALVLMTKVYRSVSTDALAVLTGVLPADLEVVRCGLVDGRRGSLTPRELAAVRIQCTNEVCMAWQERWSGVAGGMLTGHGCFRKRLYDMRLNERKECDCGWHEETRDHVLWDCPLYEEEKTVMLDGIVGAETGPVYFANLVETSKNFKVFKTFCQKWHFKRKRIGEPIELPLEASTSITDGAIEGVEGHDWKTGLAPALLGGGLAALLAALATLILLKRKRAPPCLRRDCSVQQVCQPHPQLYTTEPGKRNGKTLSPPDGDMHEISPYATFSMTSGGAENARCNTGCLLHLRTFGRAEPLDLAAPPSRPNLLRHSAVRIGKEARARLHQKSARATDQNIVNAPAAGGTMGSREKRKLQTRSDVTADNALEMRRVLYYRVSFLAPRYSRRRRPPRCRLHYFNTLLHRSSCPVHFSLHEYL
ncbi:Retrovirus-related Pol polyprotein from type-1 retrotransposable element R1 2 [Eumeta japonica]|uniref:Retrovirus-related Pol polyprotein from type-1 retrotransposable element R1 2 n=1 Tax=Eumeta variegata TaxID=151549 RepID=A0A4C1SAJ3_EUMVA|nr:Retrovirus-related Pol polyprotein from type-1 retrotransposable element R1 2 [Eumeta japonica]